MAVVTMLLSVPALFAARGGGGGGGGGGRSGGTAKPAPSPLVAIMDKYDKNKDGKLDKGELQVIHDSDKALCDDLMKVDADKGLSLDASELSKYEESKRPKTF